MKLGTPCSKTQTAGVMVSIMDHRNYAKYDQSRTLNALNPKKRPTRPIDHGSMTPSNRRRSPADVAGFGSGGGHLSRDTIIRARRSGDICDDDDDAALCALEVTR